MLQLAKSQWWVLRFSNSGLFRLLKQSAYLELQEFLSYLLYLRVELAGGSPGMEGDKEEEEEEQGEKEEE